MEKLCIYTTNHMLFLKPLLRHPQPESVWFYSDKLWRQAANYFRKIRPMPVLIRAIDDEGESEEFFYTYQGKLAGILMRDEFGTARERDEWIDENLKFHRKCYEKERDPHVKGRVAEEKKAFQNASTYYSLCGLKEIKRVPITKLTKASGSHLSADYKHGYSVCQCP